MSLFRAFITTCAVLMLAALLAACGTVATPVWEAEPTEAAVLPSATAELYVAPSATPVPPTATPVPPTALPTTAEATAEPTEAVTLPTEADTAATEIVITDPMALTGNEPLPAQPNEAAALPADDAQAQLEVLVSISDPANGERIFNLLYAETGYACATCHSIQPDIRGVGPSLWGIGERAATRVGGMNAATYLQNSIVHPLDYIVTGWTPEIAIMPRVYGEILTENEILDVIAYLLTLHD